VRGTFARLQRIYETSDDQLVQGVALAAMADVVERKEAVNLLERLARQRPGDPGYPRVARAALRTLVAMDEDGRAALKRLHETGAVRDQEAQHELSVMAERGYRTC